MWRIGHIDSQRRKCSQRVKALGGDTLVIEQTRCKWEKRENSHLDGSEIKER
jgi:hypothetical protein